VAWLAALTLVLSAATPFLVQLGLLAHSVKIALEKGRAETDARSVEREPDSNGKAESDAQKSGSKAGPV
jgi:hypothetical protein